METIKANFRDGIVEDSYLWVFDNQLQAICKVDLQTTELSVVSRYIANATFTVEWMLFYNMRLYMLTTKEPKILIYDMKEEVFIEEFDYSEFDARTTAITGAYIYNDSIWMMPHFANGRICRYNLKSGKFVAVATPLLEMKRYKQDVRMGIMEYCVTGNILWFTVFDYCAYVKYDMDKDYVHIFELKDKKRKLCGVYSDGTELWITQLDTSNVLNISSDNDIREIVIEGGKHRPHSSIVFTDTNIICVPKYNCKFITIDKKDKLVKEYYAPGILAAGDCESATDKYHATIEENGIMYFMPVQAHSVICYDQSVEAFSTYHPKYSGKYSVDVMKFKMIRDKQVVESTDITLTTFIEYLKECE